MRDAHYFVFAVDLSTRVFKRPKLLLPTLHQQKIWVCLCIFSLNIKTMSVCCHFFQYVTYTPLESSRISSKSQCWPGQLHFSLVYYLLLFLTLSTPLLTLLSRRCRCVVISSSSVITTTDHAFVALWRIRPTWPLVTRRAHRTCWFFGDLFYLTFPTALLSASPFPTWCDKRSTL